MATYDQIGPLFFNGLSRHGVISPGIASDMGYIDFNAIANKAQLFWKFCTNIGPINVAEYGFNGPCFFQLLCNLYLTDVPSMPNLVDFGSSLQDHQVQMTVSVAQSIIVSS